MGTIFASTSFRQSDWWSRHWQRNNLRLVFLWGANFEGIIAIEKHPHGGVSLVALPHHCHAGGEVAGILSGWNGHEMRYWAGAQRQFVVLFPLLPCLKAVLADALEEAEVLGTNRPVITLRAVLPLTRYTPELTWRTEVLAVDFIMCCLL